MEELKLAFESTKGVVEQLIALATGVITLSITFTKDIAERQVRHGLGVLKLAWTLYLSSILCGLVTLMGITGVAVTLAERHAEGGTGMARAEHVRAMASDLSKIAPWVATEMDGGADAVINRCEGNHGLMIHRDSWKTRADLAAAASLQHLGVRLPAMLQVVLFAFATGAILRHGWVSFRVPKAALPADQNSGDTPKK